MVAETSQPSSPSRGSPAATGPADRAVLSGREAAHDADLVHRFIGGDEEAFVEIVERYRGKMYSVALCHLRNHADAEEIAQDTFIRAHRGLARFRGDCSLATWLHRIAFNLSRNRFKYHFCRRRHATLSLDCAFSDDNRSTFAELIASDAPCPAREAAAGEFSELVLASMERLDARQREILALRNGLNRSYVEIGRALGLNIGTVKSRIARARENLRAFIAEAYPESSPGAPPIDWFDPIRSRGRVEAVCA